ncbi:MAG: transporter substrate-binding protein [Bacilli bacterium]|nr:transporter substrate-binding protein [Bacilli bacterium]
MACKGKKWIWIISGGILLAGCGVKEGVSPTSNVNTSPVTLSLYMYTPAPDQFIQDSIVKPVEKKFPNITLKIVNNTSAATPQQLIASGNVPDLMYGSILFNVQELIDLGMLYDMNDLIKKDHFDINQINSTVVKEIKSMGNHGEIYALPFYINYQVLYYNKDIFNKFGVQYPKDGMTWDQVTALGQKLSETSNGVTYEGLAVPSPVELAYQLALPFVDPKTHQALLDTDDFRKIFELDNTIYNSQNGMQVSGPQGGFLKNKTEAMYLRWGDTTQTLVAMAQSGDAMNWDMVTSPFFSGTSGYTNAVDQHDLLISQTSTHKDLDFQVVSYLVSKDYQMELARNGYLSALTDPDLQKSFGANSPELKGKNLQAIFKSNPVPVLPMTSYDGLAQNEIFKYVTLVETGKLDVNTALRQANDAANKDIQAAIQQQGN